MLLRAPGLPTLKPKSVAAKLGADTESKEQGLS